LLCVALKRNKISLSFSTGLKVVLYENAYFQGKAYVVTTDYSCFNTPSFHFNDVVSSIKVLVV